MRLFRAILFFCFLCNMACAAQETLPVIRLTGDFGYDYQEGQFSITDTDGTSQETLSARIKWRGDTSNAEDKHKRNYKVKFDADVSFLGMRTDNNWILDAGQKDVFRLRNVICTRLWTDFAHKPYYIESEPKAFSGVRGRVCELYLNGEYRGIYCLTECMDRKQMKLRKFDAQAGIHGILWKATGYGCSQMKYVPESYDNKSAMMDVFEAKYPDLNDLDTTDYKPLWEAIDFVVNSTDEEFRSAVSEYFDMPVMIDYFLFVNVIGGLDNCGKNMYWAVYDKEKSRMLTPAVWDLDMTFGSHYLESYKAGYSSPQYGPIDPTMLYTRLIKLNVDDFNSKLKRRYTELRKTVFSTTSLYDRFYNYYELLKNSGAAAREEELWSGDSDILGQELDFDTEITYLEDWIEKRIAYLDGFYFDASMTDVNKIHDAVNGQMGGVYNMYGQRLSDIPRKGMYIYNGRKIVR